MKKLNFIGCTVAVLLSFSAPAHAQISVEANGARADARWGGEFGIGYGVGAAGFRLMPAVGLLIYRGENDRYYEDSNGGNPRCRDSSNGQYASSSKCDNTAVRPYGRLEATYTIPLIATIGGGVRIGSDVRPYGTVALPLLPKISLKGNAGPHYYALGLRLGL